jgi:hypothetical protein
MRRRIEVFQGFFNTSFFLLDPLFSSLPLALHLIKPIAAGVFLSEGHRPIIPLFHYSITPVNFERSEGCTAPDSHSVNSVTSVAKKNKLKGGSLCRHYQPMSHTCF